MGVLDWKNQRSRRREVFYKAREYFFTVPGVLKRGLLNDRRFVRQCWERRVNYPPGKKRIFIRNNKAYCNDDQGRPVKVHPKYD
ncbi:MAG: hypothetical protein KKF68_03290, partial [Nanoarchaeota archaeon]|nr:hypothetical protein [Nanoarchaeota archaeon]